MSTSRVPYSQDELFATGPQRTYTGPALREIAFPLGGIGAGMVSLGGWGQLRDWEIMNRPAKGRSIPNTFFCVRVESGKKPPVVKALQGPAMGEFSRGGHTAAVEAGQGLPHFRNCRFTGEFPFAQVQLDDPGFPLEVTLTAFNPLIPLNEDDSSIPVAILMYALRNTGKTRLKLSVMGNLTNIMGDPAKRASKARTGKGLTALAMTAQAGEPESPQTGSMCLATPAGSAWVWPQWNDDRLLKFWEAIAWDESFPPKRKGGAHTGTLGVDLELEAGATVTVPFFIAWHSPIFEHWEKDPECDCAPTWRNWYASQWKDAWDVAGYTSAHFDRLYTETRRFHEALFSSTLPAVALDAISSQISILKTPTCLRLQDGTFYGFEGCSDNVGCCEGSCTHVWNYAQAAPFLFPRLQRSMRDAEWRNSLLPDGFVAFRMPLPLGKPGRDAFHPAADGQMGTVIQVYREWQISGDDEWLRATWPQAKRALEFAWKYWDSDRDGVMEGMQHNTYDMEFWGANTMMGSLYLGALRAAEEIARYLGETESADTYRALFESGSRISDETLFNGEYYEQQVNTRANEGWPEHLKDLNYYGGGRDDRFKDWPRWQFGRGCLSDQLIGQWYGAMLGLGHFYKPGNVRKALQSVFRYNWKPDMSDHFCSLRVYAMNDEAGMVIASWPRDERPGYAFWFADEVWCGIEYQVASHLIYEGLVAEGLAVVKGVRDRHTGWQRNPWDEFECGHHYARSMASYAVLTALQGFSYSAVEQRMGFAPRVNAEDFRSFFCVGSGWGSYAQELGDKGARISVTVEGGSLTLARLQVEAELGASVSAKLAGKAVPVTVEAKGKRRTLVFAEPVTIAAGETLAVKADLA